ncbi:solute carrier family 25 [Cordyceps militaris]|uniref:Solute carrier family 25 n=1 Tax=Cordyceps militaris TaxID=73501 RepID=A0A2H4SNV4_CORMI|nr:solute carrier family 25 [Cordyceps militaris]
MSTDFWAGYASGAVGIIVGNPLDIVKLRQQTTQHTSKTTITFQSYKSLLAGATAPLFGYGALNAILFVSYNRTEKALNRALGSEKSLAINWVAGAVGGLATWIVSAPTELVKCRAQMVHLVPTSSLSIATDIWRKEGIRGLYFGGLVTALRDSIGYGFYFWSYEFAIRNWTMPDGQKKRPSIKDDAPRVMLCGGLAGIVTWTSVFPLDVIKTRLQTQGPIQRHDMAPQRMQLARKGAQLIARNMFREGGMRPFFRGLTVCSIRAFVVNATQWTVYEGLMYKFGEGRFREGEAAEHA